MNCDYIRKLPSPSELIEQLPMTREMEETKKNRDEQIKAFFTGESNKFIMIVGPCSADRQDSVIDYITHLQQLQEKVKDKLILIPRVYTNKPRTTGIGYKGMLHNPDPTTESDMLGGLMAIRKLHMAVISETGLTAADEMLYPDNYRYLSDLLSYVAVGARSVENQQHRLTASAIPVPVGMKNPTSGDIAPMLNAVAAAQYGQTFIYRGWEIKSHGNKLAHAILRGGTDAQGKSFSNYHYENLINLYEEYTKKNLANRAVVVDANHSNSGKHYLEQIRICKDVMYSRKQNSDIRKMVKGLMVESYLIDGCQKPTETTYGLSITDPCLGWEKTEKLIYDVAEEA